MSKYEKGSFKSSVVSSYMNPLIRSVGFERDVKKHGKKNIKNWYAAQAKKMQAATHYVLDNDLLEVILTSVKNKKVRHFYNAFFNARPPNKNFFVEWDCSSFLVTKPDGTGVDTARLNPFSVKPKLSYSPRDAHAAKKILAGGVHSQYVAHSNWGKLRSQVEKRILPINTNHEHEYSFHALVESDFNQSSTVTLSSPFVYGVEDFDRTPSISRERKEEIGIKRHLCKWLDLEDLNSEMFQVLDYFFVAMSPYVGDVRQYVERSSEGQHFINELEIENPWFEITIAAISLLNYDWVVNKEDGKIARGIQSVNTAVLPKDVFKTVTINLPKDKAIALYNKQKPRTRKFGTAEHVVRGHWRFYKKTGERVWIGEHHRGDKKYGTIHKDYVLTKRENYLR